MIDKGWNSGWNDCTLMIVKEKKTISAVKAHKSAKITHSIVPVL